MPTDINDHNLTESLTAIDLVALHDISIKGKHKRNALLRNISSTLKNNIKVMQKNLNIATQQINKIQRIELYEQQHAIDACAKELYEQKKTLDERVQVADEQTKELDERMKETLKQHGNLAHLQVLDKNTYSMLKHMQDVRLTILAERTTILELNVAIVQQHAIYLESYLKIRNQHITLNKKDKEMEKEIERSNT